MVWLLISLIVIATVGAYITGRLHARNRASKARGGMLPAPHVVVDRWNFPAAPKLYDQALDPDAPDYAAGEAGDYSGTTPRASLGHPLIPDPTSLREAELMADAMDRLYPLTGPDGMHSRRVS